MSTIEELIELVRNLIKQTFHLDNQTRSDAEKTLEQVSKENPALFLTACVSILQGENEVEQVRNLAGILMKRTLEMATEGAETLWVNLPAEVKAVIKELILGALGASSEGVKRIAANLIGMICAIEIPRKEWNDIIPLLVKNTNHEVIGFKKTAILTLGEICEQFKSKQALEPEVVDSILTGICLSIKEDSVELKELGLAALHNILAFVEQHFSKKEVREFVLNLVLQTCLVDNKSTKIKALQVLMDICKLHYDKMEEYLTPLLQATLDNIRDKDKLIAVPAIEVWNVIASEDKERLKSYSESGKNLAFDKNSLNLMAKVYTYLVPTMLANLLDAPKYEDNDDEGEFNTIAATANCLTSICEVIGDLFLQFGTEFVGVHILSETDFTRRAALIAFACMLDGPSKDKLMPLIEVALERLCNYVFSPNLLLQIAASVVLQKIAELHPEGIILSNKAAVVLDVLTQKIASKPRVSVNVLKAWGSLGDEIRKYPNFNYKLEPIMEQVIINGFRNDIDSSDLSLIDQSFATLMTFTMCIRDDADLHKWVAILLQKFATTVQIPTERRKTIQSGLLSALQTTIMNITQGQIKVELGNSVYQMIVEYFTLIGDIAGEGIYVLSALAGAMGKNFEGFALQYYDAVQRGLQRTNEGMLFNASLEGLVEIGNAVPMALKDKLPALMEYFYGLLNNASIDRNVKLKIITSIGYLSMHCKELSLTCFDGLIKIYDMIIEVAIQPPTEQNLALADYLENLRETLLDSYTCFEQGIENTQGMPAMIQHFPKMITFLQVACNEIFNPTVDFLRSSLTLIADMGEFYGKDTQPLVKTEFTYRLMNIFQKFCDNNIENKKIYAYVERVLKKFH
jgi:importin subunit beta-1